MRIQHNISALIAANHLKATERAISKNILRLSSGYRINSAADDPAGLAISERMRAQINGLEQAEANTQDGISLVQTAEGGMSVTQEILRRLNTLAVESANGTYQGNDRTNMQKEFNDLKAEIDRISTSTNFNQINLLDGSLGSGVSSPKPTVELSGFANAHGAFTFTDATYGMYTAAAVNAVSIAGDNQEYDYSIQYVDKDGGSKNLTVNLYLDGTNSMIKDSNGHTLAACGTNNATATNIGDAVVKALSENLEFPSEFHVTNSAGSLSFHSVEKGDNEGSIAGIVINDHHGMPNVSLSLTGTGGQDAYEGTDTTHLAVYDGSNAADAVFTVNGQAFAFVTMGGSTSGLSSSVNTIKLTGASIGNMDTASMAALINSKTGLKVQSRTTTLEYITQSRSPSDGALVLQVGADNKADQRISISIGNMSCKGLGIDTISIATPADARRAIDAIKHASDTVSSARANMGAIQNELEFTSQNLSTMCENLSAAESKIRDVDYSEEIVDYSRNLILEQIANAMLAQANAIPKGILALLQS